MKKIILIAAILAVVINLTACKTQKNFSKQPDVPLVYVVDTQNTSTEVLEAILAEEKKGNKKKVKNNWYPNLSGYPLPEKITEESEKNVTYIFNIDLTILPEEDEPVYTPVFPDSDNEQWLGADISQVLPTPFFMVVLALLFGFLLGYFSRRDRVSSIPTTSVATSFGQVPYDGTAVVRIIDVLRQTGGKFSCTHGESTIAVDIPEQKKVEPEKKD